MTENKTELFPDFCTIRDADDEIHLECRFPDGQKVAAVIVSIDFPELAEKIANFINTHGNIVETTTHEIKTLDVQFCEITSKKGDTWYSDMCNDKSFKLHGYRILPLEDYNNESLLSFIRRRNLWGE